MRWCTWIKATRRTSWQLRRRKPARRSSAARRSDGLGARLCCAPAKEGQSTARSMRIGSWMSGGAFADGFFGEEGLLADAVGDFGEFALIGTDGGEVIHLTNNKKGAEGFPDLLVARIDGGDFRASGY